MSGYVIQYHRKNGDYTLEAFEGINGSREAMLRRLQLETERTDRDVEIVALNGRSLDSIKITHSRYFHGRELHPA